jgi:hypothetical protein
MKNWWGLKDNCTFSKSLLKPTLETFSALFGNYYFLLIAHLFTLALQAFSLFYVI